MIVTQSPVHLAKIPNSHMELPDKENCTYLIEVRFQRINIAVRWLFLVGLFRATPYHQTPPGGYFPLAYHPPEIPSEISSS